ncbi:hypothetical protein A3J43_02690 [Candidatus Uhrbacteria bacterium RIFCSPHIGHO2_12_FULL_54_23]|uniref:SMP-30/Gluconolactonase/LRE-like region domain-containing protein n=3 Tax=Candidatus Uhriibacteriota TaxID=1752732 RepID=A0A1F7UMS0_9BACT|nr:MAG: hypothetical protein A3J43_02690 [Candidatus Uhrbacteria bacterium RIFCSPHIGHO2_12_FULL_54_23]OGL84386.1 MAG: hypothetical protein A3B36_02540 [Candidatus Uhrbacteria bacterium RIFCSPLOWO2_01_FULL_55_36]OGL90876.1 MAG: hypothetical protein A3J36_03260 [Candidatus Uhrbacteria bacterium RIFCSPLOWO2_02_FULL_54_37]
MALIEIDSQERKTDAVIQSMISELHARFEASRAETGEDALMEVCRRFNENANLLTKKNQAWYQRLRIALAVMDGPLLYLALHGSVRAYLMHHRKLVDILHSVQPEPGHGEKKPLKVFTSLLEGKLAEGDALLVACPHLFDYFSIERIQSLLTEKPAADVCPHLTRTLKGLPGSVCVSALVVESAPEKSAVTVPQSQKGSHQSIVDLNSLAARTAQLLTPSLTTNVTRLAHTLKPSFTPPSVPPVSSPRRAPAAPSRYALLRARLRTRASRLWQRVAMRLRALLRAALPVHDETPATPPSIWRIALRRLLARFRRLPRASQYLLVFALLLAVLFIESIISIAHQRIRAQERAAFETGTASAERMLNESEASLIYGDEEKARRALQDAAATLARINARTNGETEQYQRLAARADDLRKEVFHARTIAQPDPIVDVAAFLEGDTVLASGGLIGPSAEFILSFSAQGSTVFIIEPQRKTVTVAKPDAPDTLALVRGTAGDQGLFYFVTTEGFVRFNARERVYAPLASTASPPDIADLAIFGQRLYTLNRSSGAIMRHDFTENGLNPPTPWLTPGTSLPGATAMAIDGSIYVANAAGAIHKYTRGALQDFSVGAIEPPLTAPARLAVDNTYLYVLDPTEKRVVVLNKDGTLKEQITSPSFDRLIGFAPNLSRKVIYVLNGTVVYSVPFPPQ